MPQLPTSTHDWALWLFENLEELEFAGAHWQGRLPADVDFEAIVGAIPSTLQGVVDRHSRSIEFHPELGNVFADLPTLVDGARRRAVPHEFTVRSLQYTHGRTEPIPTPIRDYLDAVKFWGLLKSFADYEINQSVVYIKSFESKVEVRPEYGANDLVPLPGLAEFGANYFEVAHHREEKRNIVRASLLEVCKGQPVVRLGELLAKFAELVDRVKASYTLYTADFSFEKLRYEVESKNVEDMLRLNKTLADIQNQLLALPAALLIAGAGVKPGVTATNVTIWFGLTVFAWVMQKLVSNQQHSVIVIEQEVQLRIEKVNAQPADISQRVLALFAGLRNRLARQHRVLKTVSCAVWVVWLAATAVAINAEWPDVFTTCWNWLTLGFVKVWEFLSNLPG